jgi:molybdopterin/thiamine biosynthesis adenylyltransferase
MQAAEAIKLIAGTGQPMAGRLLMLDARNLQPTTIGLSRDRQCPVCHSR